MSKNKVDYNSIPKQIELFGRTIKTSLDTENLNRDRTFGEARYGVNEIALCEKMGKGDIKKDELKITYLHEMIHFILNFTGYESILRKVKDVDEEQFVDLLASAIYQYEKNAQY